MYNMHLVYDRCRWLVLRVSEVRQQRWTFFVLSIISTCFLFAAAPLVNADESIGIAVIAPSQRAIGHAMVNAAQLAVKDINAHGGVNGQSFKLYEFNSNLSATDAVRAFQKAVQQDHVVAGVGTFVDEVALALEPWAGRFKTPFIVTGAIAPKLLSKRIHEDYAKYKYNFMDNPNGIAQAKTVCQSLHDLLVEPLHAHRAVIMAEDANWTKVVVKTYQQCLPKAGLKVVKTIRYAVGTKDFAPIYNALEKSDPQVLVAATAINGLRPIVQWHDHEIPALLAGINAETMLENFYDKSNGTAEGVISVIPSTVNGVAITSKTRTFSKAYEDRFGSVPPFDAYTTYDAVQMIARAIKKADKTKGDALVRELESINYVGVNGHYEFYGKNSPATHQVKVGPNYVAVTAFQWQHGKQIMIWPSKYAQGRLKLPSFVKSAFDKE